MKDAVDSGLNIKEKPKGKLGKIGMAGTIAFAPGTKGEELFANLDDDRIQWFSELDDGSIVSDGAIGAVADGIINASNAQTYGTDDEGRGVFESKEDFERAMPALANAGYYAVSFTRRTRS